jgi:hypothetical protein
MKHLAFAVGVTLVGALSGPVRAADGADQAAATELFNAGRDMMKRGEYAGACPKLAESVRLDATVGALAKLAECEEHEGRLASAYGRWQQALNLARSTSDARMPDVERELARVDGRVPKLRIVPEGPLPDDVAIHVDAREMGSAGSGTPLPVEPGRHTVQVMAPGRVPWSTTIETAADGATTTVPVPALAEVPAVVFPPPPPPRVPDVPPPSGDASASPWRTFAFASAGAGVAALAAGAVLGLEAMHERDQAGCPGNLCPDDGAANTLRSAKTTAAWSTGLFIAGGVLAGCGVTAWWLTRDHRDGAAAVVLTPGGAFGRF